MSFRPASGHISREHCSLALGVACYAWNSRRVVGDAEMVVVSVPRSQRDAESSQAMDLNTTRQLMLPAPRASFGFWSFFLPSCLAFPLVQQSGCLFT